MAINERKLRIHSVQPVGLYGFPLSHLLLPAIEVNEPDNNKRVVETQLQAIVSKWCRGCRGEVQLAQVPEPWRFFAMALDGEIQAAIAFLKESTVQDPVVQLNRFALAPTKENYRELLPQLDGDAREWLENIAFAAGILDSLPIIDDLQGELLAVGLAAGAAQEIEHGNPAEAIVKLTQAIAACRNGSTCLAAMLCAQRGDVAFSMPNANLSMAIQDYRHAIQAIQDTHWNAMMVELHIKLGMALQSSAGMDRGALLEAIQSYQYALQNGIDAARHSEMFATLQNNLGLAYLAMPQVESSSQLRMGIAVQSFRHALTIFTKESDHDRWASTCMNLANALQYAPTSHPQENLIQAVELYEEVLTVRTRAKDPVAYAIVLHNQANALAHLGIFKPSLEKLSEAYKLFQWYEQTEQAEAARELVDQINMRMTQSHEWITETLTPT